MTNTGPRGEGYTYCTLCGLIEPTTGRVRRCHRRPPQAVPGREGTGLPRVGLHPRPGARHRLHLRRPARPPQGRGAGYAAAAVPGDAHRPAVRRRGADDRVGAPARHRGHRVAGRVPARAHAPRARWDWSRRSTCTTPSPAGPASRGGSATTAWTSSSTPSTAWRTARPAATRPATSACAASGTGSSTGCSTGTSAPACCATCCTARCPRWTRPACPARRTGCTKT